MLNIGLGESINSIVEPTLGSLMCFSREHRVLANVKCKSPSKKVMQICAHFQWFLFARQFMRGATKRRKLPSHRIGRGKAKQTKESRKESTKYANLQTNSMCSTQPKVNFNLNLNLNDKFSTAMRETSGTRNDIIIILSCFKINTR